MIESLRSKYESLTKRDIREVAAPIAKEGTELAGGRNYATRELPKGWDLKIFTPSTVVLDGGWAEWDLEVPQHVRESLVDMTLRIETIRTHGMLHSPREGKRAWVYVNGQLVDEIVLLRLHPHGGDFGVDTRRPLPILSYVDRGKDCQTVKVETEKDVAWDIDRVTLEAIILRKEPKPEVMMIVGAVLSAIAGAVAAAVVSFVT